MSSTKRRPRALISCSTFDYDHIPDQLTCLGGSLISNMVTRMEAAGIDAVRMENLSRTLSPEAALEGFDMLVVLGGDDVHPDLYGAERQPDTATSPDDRGDRFEIALVQNAVTAGTPVLGICRGMQVVNVALGGSLVQHLEPAGEHYQPADKLAFSDHSVRLEPGTRLASAFASSEIDIRSAHHQAVQTLGKGLAVAARAEDGTVEAIEHCDGNLVIGLQWHPEELRADPRQLDAILRLFVEKF